MIFKLNRNENENKFISLYLDGDGHFEFECKWSLDSIIYRVPCREFGRFLINKLMKNANQVIFEIPEDVSAMLADSPESYLKGVCRESFRGWKDGTRMNDLISNEFDLNEMNDLILEWALFDFATGDCEWPSFEYCQEVGWEYFSQNLINRLSGDSDSLADEISGWWAWWMKMEMKEGARLYSDGSSKWKMAILNEFEKMAKRANRKKNRVFPDKRNCNEIEPVMALYSRRSGIIEKLKLWKKMDVSSGSGPGKHAVGPVGGVPTNGLILRPSFFVEACAGICVRIGLGLVFCCCVRSWWSRSPDPGVCRLLAA